MSYVPEFVALYEIEPYIILTLDNETIRVAVRDYFSGDKEKDAIIKKYGKIEDWNTSEVTDMSGLFYPETMYHYSDFIEDISKWDTSKVTNMSYMFFHNWRFNQPIGEWDTSNVIYMEGMFAGALFFNQPIGEWDTSKVTNMRDLFYAANNFNRENAPWYNE